MTYTVIGQSHEYVEVVVKIFLIIPYCVSKICKSVFKKENVSPNLLRKMEINIKVPPRSRQNSISSKKCLQYLADNYSILLTECHQLYRPSEIGSSIGYQVLHITNAMRLFNKSRKFL